MNTETIERPTTEIAEYNATAAGLAELRSRLKDVAYDVTTTKGMAVAVKDRAEVRGLRVGLEKMRVSIKAPALERCRLIDAKAKKLTAELEVLEESIDDQIKVEEKRKAAEAEAKRMAEITRREGQSVKLAAIRQRTINVQGKSAQIIGAEIVALHSDQLDGFDSDYSALAKIAKDETRAALGEMHQAAIDLEAEDAARKAEAEALAKERAELAKLRAEQDARDKAARDEIAAQQRAADEARSKADAEARALRDAEESRLRAERAEQQAKIDAERAELRKAQDEAYAAQQLAEIERNRVAAAALAVERAELQAKEDAERAARIASEDAVRAKAEAEHAADAKGRNAWATLAHVCELVMAGEKLATIKVCAKAALTEAGRL